MDNLTFLKNELKKRYNVSIKCSPLQGGCIAIKHKAEDTIKVRYVAKKIVGFTLISNKAYRSAYCSKSNANTIIY